MTEKPVRVARHARDRNVRRALTQFVKPENWFTVRKALNDARRRRAEAGGHDHYHAVANPAKSARPQQGKDRKRKRLLFRGS